MCLKVYIFVPNKNNNVCIYYKEGEETELTSKVVGKLPIDTLEI